MKIPAKGFTHGGKFHADDVFATALLMIVRPDIKVTRGFVVPDGFDGIVYDVGCGMFDHHQEPRESRPQRRALCGLWPAVARVGCPSWWVPTRPACWMKILFSPWT